MGSKNQYTEEATESSPLRPDIRMTVTQENSSTFNQSFERTEVDEPVSYTTWAATTWGKWNNVTRTLIIVLGFTMIIGAVLLIVSISGGSSSTSGVVVQQQRSLLKQQAHSSDETEPGLVLDIPQGQLKWNILKSREGRNYYAFYKVPYSKPPLGDLRFASPQAPEPWEGVRFEKQVAPQCLQKIKYSDIIEAGGEEDCLYMNIYTPKLPGIELEEGKLMPTLFYIHGGGFTDGNGSRYGGKYFMDEDAVLITFQYRLGIFGFLSSEDGTIKGNMALKDQIQALIWTRDNIKYFGGSPDSVMIYGNSAGAMSVNQLIVSPMAAGLFQRAITESGASFGAITKPHDLQLKSYEALATEAGCWPRISDEKRRNRRVLKCLRDQNASDIAVLRGPDIIFASTIETYEGEDESDKFLPDTLYNLFKAGKVNKVPWLIGVNNNEWISIAAETLMDPEQVENLNSNWTNELPSIFIAPYTNSLIKDEISEKIKEFYFEGKPLGNESLQSLTNLLSDRDIIYGSKLQGSWMAEFRVDVFLYYLSKRPAKSYSDKALANFPPGDYGASHADELQYLFNYSGYPEYPPGSEHYKISRYMVKVWVQFAATGQTGWNPIKPGESPISWYELNDNPGYTTVLEGRMKFWDQFTPEELCYT